MIFENPQKCSQEGADLKKKIAFCALGVHRQPSKLPDFMKCKKNTINQCTLMSILKLLSDKEACFALKSVVQYMFYNVKNQNARIPECRKKAIPASLLSPLVQVISPASSFRIEVNPVPLVKD